MKTNENKMIQMTRISKIIRNVDSAVPKFQALEIAEKLIRHYGEDAELVAGAPYRINGVASW